MKQFYLILSLLLCMFFLFGCAAEAAPTEPSTEAENAVPQELVGTWTSADSGELDMTETFTFNEDGTLSAYAVYHGTQSSTITGTFRAEGHTVYCEVTGGVTEPYSLVYEFRVDGRELYLTDDDGDAHFLRVS